ncbi:MAG: leucine-rich repeat domain-containing protein [Paludibacteraceae bacterium]|nr:leucine-rich repeat domain-containing protein [Paludibacteraceae bacterium]
MSLKKIVAVIISLLLLIPISKNWISLFISTYEEYKANENKDEEPVTITTVEENDSEEKEEHFPQRTDKATDAETHGGVAQEIPSRNDAETQNPIYKKERNQDTQENQEKHKAKKSDIVDAADSPLKFRFSSCNKRASIEYDPSYENLISLNIPHKVRYNGDVYTVYYIDYKVFYNCQNIVKIEIPSSINVSYSSFHHFNKLTSIIVAPDHPTLSSEKGILYNKDKSEIIRVPTGFKGEFKLLNSVKKIGQHAFQDCKGLTNIEFPSNVTEIGDYAFDDCKGLTNLVIPSNISSIGSHAFSGCSGLTNVEIQVPTNVKFSSYVFSGCKKLKSFEIPPHITKLPDGFFSNCSSFENFEIPSYITSIGKYAFSYCSGMTYVIIPKSVTAIGNGAFSSCTGLTNIIISENVSFLGDGAFSNCKNLNVLVDNSKKNVEYNTSTFQGCKSLRWTK